MAAQEKTMKKKMPKKNKCAEADAKDIDWRANKTGSECNRFMLENEIATDICFAVGPPGGPTIKLCAHVYMLASRSQVFETMFFGGFARSQFSSMKTISRKSEIRVDDIDVDTFKEMLRFIGLYYDDCTIVTLSSAPSLMYVAKKYMLSHLFRLCCECLQKDVDVDNVEHFLDLSLLFDVKDLRDECLKLISDKAGAILTSSKLNNISRAALELILDLDKIAADESLVYYGCINWAKHQLRTEQFIENPTDQQIRKVLDCLIHRIRFPTMNPKEFAELVGESEVLTAEEKSSVFCYFVTKNKADTPMFNVETRNEFAVELFSKVKTSSFLRVAEIPFTCEIDFTPDQDIIVTAVALYSCKDTPYPAGIKVFREWTTLLSQRSRLLFH